MLRRTSRKLRTTKTSEAIQTKSEKKRNAVRAFLFVQKPPSLSLEGQRGFDRTYA